MMDRVLGSPPHVAIAFAAPVAYLWQQRMIKRDALGDFSMVRVFVIVAIAFGLCTFQTKASCLEDFQSHMSEVYHHGPYKIDGQHRDDQSEWRSEVKIIYPNKMSFKSYDKDNNILFGAIDIDNSSWRVGGDGHWSVFRGEDALSLKNVIARGSGDFRTATQVVCTDPVPNIFDNFTHFQYLRPFRDGRGNYQAFITFDRTTSLPIRSEFSWSVPPHSGEDIYTYRFDPDIHIASPIVDTFPK